jgi:hypothetical protein
MSTGGVDGTERGWGAAGFGLLATVIGGLFLAQAGGSDDELFQSIGFLLVASGFLGMLIGGVAIGIQLARD